MLISDLIVAMLLVSAISMGALALYGRRFIPRVPAALPYSLLMAMAGLWALVYACEILSVPLSGKVLFHLLRFVPLPFISFLELWLVLAYIGRGDWLRRDRAAALLVIPVLSVFIALTSPYHTLFRNNFSIDVTGPVPVLLYSDGPFFTFYMLYNLAVLIAAYAVLVYVTWRKGTLLQPQTLLLLLALGFPTVINYLFVAGVSPVPGVNMTAPLLWAAAALYTAAIFWYQFLDIIPVARGQLVETMSTLVFVIDKDDRVIDMNPAARLLFDIPKDAKPGMHISEVVRDWPELIEFCHRLDGGAAEMTRTGRTGTQTFMVTADVIRSPSREPEGRLVMLQDVTREKAAELALRESEERLALTIGAINEGLWDWDIPSGKAYFATYYYTMLGYEPGEFPGSYESFRSLIHPDDVAGIDARIQEHIEKKDAGYAIEFRMRDQGGSYRWVLSRGKVVSWDEGGRPVRMVGTHTDITGRKEAEEALKAEKNLWRATFDSIPDLIAIIDENHRVVQMNRAMAEKTGLQPDTASSLFCYQLVHGTDAPPSYCPHVQMMQDGKTHTTETDLPLLNGYYMITTSPLFRPDGSISGSVHVVRDITARKQAEEALRASEEKYRTLFENMTEGFAYCRMLYDADGHPEDFIYLNVNQAFDRITGTPAVTGKPVTAVYPGIRADFPQLFEIYGRVAKTGLPESFEVHFAPIGKRLRISVYSPALEHFVAVFEDITERKRVEEALRESEEQFRVIFQSQQTGLVMIDPVTHLITDANETALAMIGASRGEVIGRVCHTFICPAEQGKCPVTDLRQPVDNSERVLLKKNGQRVPIIKSVNPATLKGKQFLIESFIDITARKQAELALQQANKKLNLLSSITRHDILNQLTALRGYLDLSHDLVNNPEKMEEYLAKEERAAATIESQITFTRDYQELGASAPVWTPVRETVEKAAGQLPLRGIVVSPGPADLEIFADPLFEKVCYNLIDNALRYGGPNLAIIRFSATESGPGLLLVCEDDGAGISDEDKIHLFTRGFGKNTGLGLFLSREILSITGITITETGEPGKGARFEITVPNGAYRFTPLL